MTERMLITKLVRQGDRADLYAKGHQYRDLVLFDLSDLADVGIDYANLETGAEVPCRFWATYELSDKLNKAGNPYKDVIALERIDTPATTTSTDNSALLAELRQIRKLLHTIACTMGLQEPASHPDPPPEPPDNGPDWSAYPDVYIGNTDENADWIKTADNRASEARIHEELARDHEAGDELPDTPDLDEAFGPRPELANGIGDVPMNVDGLMAWLNRRNGGAKCTSTGHLLYGIKKVKGEDWGWPNTTDQAGWRDAAGAWLEYAASL